MSIIIGHEGQKDVIPNHWQDSTRPNCSVIKVLIDLCYNLSVLQFNKQKTRNLEERSGFFASPITAIFVLFLSLRSNHTPFVNGKPFSEQFNV